MKQLLLLSIFISSVLVKGQTCSTNLAATDFFYPNTTSTYSTQTGMAYLCGPNTIVYDTILNSSGAYLNSGTTLYMKSNTIMGNSQFILKNNSSIIILPNSVGGVILRMEPLATYTNLSSYGVSTIACSSVSFPTVNCATGITEIQNQKDIFNIWPNPSSSKINIEFINSSDPFADVKIINQLGEIVVDRKRWPLLDKEINIEDLSSGTYFIQVKTKFGQQTEKLIVLR